VDSLPLPPLEFRRLVGPTDDASFDNPRRTLVFPDVPEVHYESVFDFGCGCGRIARQLMQQEPRPGRYVGVDPHAGMVEWCQKNLSPHAPGFSFFHHDVRVDGSSADKPRHRQLPVADDDITLFVAWSVFTHLLEEDAVFYLEELARVLAPGGLAVTTWFTFDKSEFPMMQEFQNALFINHLYPTNAVIFDRAWLTAVTGRLGLAMTHIVAPALRGYQWTVHLEHQTTARRSVPFPEDAAGRGIVRAYAGQASAPAHD
jgi:SAM-dependent methyltransferase